MSARCGSGQLRHVLAEKPCCARRFLSGIQRQRLTVHSGCSRPMTLDHRIRTPESAANLEELIRWTGRVSSIYEAGVIEQCVGRIADVGRCSYYCLHLMSHG